MRSTLLASGLLALVVAGGCSKGPPVHVVKGTLLQGGKPVLPGKDGITMVFLPVEATGQTYPAEFNNEDGTFTVNGPDRKGIPPGKYKVTIDRMSSNPTPAIERMNAKFSGASPIEVEVKGPEPIEIDLAKYGK
jgi:hypothetical protein